jgi:hypothetical protein
MQISLFILNIIKALVLVLSTFLFENTYLIFI